MKFLIDECLSPTLAKIARTRGFPESTHVAWIGLRSRQDWVLVHRAIDDGYVLVTNDRADFTSLMDVFAFREELVAEYERFSRSFTRIRAEDISRQVDEAYASGHFWPAPLVQLNPNFEPGGYVDEFVAEGALNTLFSAAHAIRCDAIE